MQCICFFEVLIASTEQVSSRLCLYMRSFRQYAKNSMYFVPEGSNSQQMCSRLCPYIRLFRQYAKSFYVFCSGRFWMTVFIKVMSIYEIIQAICQEMYQQVLGMYANECSMNVAIGMCALSDWGYIKACKLYLSRIAVYTILDVTKEILNKTGLNLIWLFAFNYFLPVKLTTGPVKG